MLSTRFLLAEDAALKAHFKDITVEDDRNAARPVKIFFRYPEAETEREYPFITIEMIDISHSRDRQHSEVVLFGGTGTNASVFDGRPNQLSYWPSTSASLNPYSSIGEYVQTDEFIPVDLTYQVSTYCRTALHDRQMSSQMLHYVTRFRYGFIHIPEDNSIRRLDLLDWVTADLLDPEAGYRKRIFRKVYTLRMNAELTAMDLIEVKRALTVTTDIIDQDSQLTETVTITE